MIEFGKTLSAAREAKGFSIRQIAEMTRMAPTTVQELESEDFSHIAAPIYGRGFVKLYCEAIGLDPKPLVAEFMELFNGTRETSIKERPVTDPEPAPAAPEPEPPMQKDVLLTPTAPEPEPEPAPEPPPLPDLFNQEPVPAAAAPAAPQEPQPPLSRYAAPVRQSCSPVSPRAYLRLGILSVGVLLLIVLLGFGIRAVYRATTPKTPAPAPEAEVSAKRPSVPSAENKAPRTPQKVPSLYID